MRERWRRPLGRVAGVLLALSLGAGMGAGGAVAHPAAPATGGRGPQGTAADWLPGRVVVQLRDRQGLGLLGGLLGRLGVQAQAAPGGAGLYLLQGSAGLDVAAAVATLRGNPAVAYAEPDYPMHLLQTPNDEHYSDQEWWLIAL